MAHRVQYIEIIRRVSSNPFITEYELLKDINFDDLDLEETVHEVSVYLDEKPELVVSGNVSVEDFKDVRSLIDWLITYK